MFARGWACLHTACPERGRRAHLLVPKTPAAKPRVSISSKLIENTRLQILYFGHLRKTGGRGSYQLPICRPLFPPHSFTLSAGEGLTRRSFSEGGLSPLFPLHAKTTPVSPLFPLHTQKWRGTPPVENVGAPTFSIFPLIFRTLGIRLGRRGVECLAFGEDVVGDAAEFAD
jgi:hypothetical protein